MQRECQQRTDPETENEGGPGRAWSSRTTTKGLAPGQEPLWSQHSPLTWPPSLHVDATRFLDEAPSLLDLLLSLPQLGLWRERTPAEAENKAPTEAGGGSPGWEACRVLVPQASERISSACSGHGPHGPRLLLHPTPTFPSPLFLCSPWLQSPSQAPLPPRSPQ